MCSIYLGICVYLYGLKANRYIQEDENLAGIFAKLGNHVDSIQTNIKQVQGISEAITTSRAAVQATLFNHLESVQYEDIVLG